MSKKLTKAEIEQLTAEEKKELESLPEEEIEEPRISDGLSREREEAYLSWEEFLEAYGKYLSHEQIFWMMVKGKLLIAGSPPPKKGMLSMDSALKKYGPSRLIEFFSDYNIEFEMASLHDFDESVLADKDADTSHSVESAEAKVSKESKEMTSSDELKPLIEDRSEKKGQNSAAPLYVPANTDWENIVMRFANSEVVQIIIGEKVETKNFYEIGFAGHKKEPAKAWQLLLSFAGQNGVLYVEDLCKAYDNDEFTLPRKHISLLRNKLKALFPTVAGDPIEYESKQDQTRLKSKESLGYFEKNLEFKARYRLRITTTVSEHFEL